VNDDYYDPDDVTGASLGNEVQAEEVGAINGNLVSTNEPLVRCPTKVRKLESRKPKMLEFGLEKLFCVGTRI